MGEPPATAITARFPASPWSVGRARRFALEALGPNRNEREVVELLVSELASNAVRHAQTGFEVSVSVGETTHVDVSDGSPLPPTLTGLVDGRDDGGLGLVLVDRLAVAWGFRRTASGKTVWFEAGPKRR